MGSIRGVIHPGNKEHVVGRRIGIIKHINWIVRDEALIDDLGPNWPPKCNDLVDEIARLVTIHPCYARRDADGSSIKSEADGRRMTGYQPDGIGKVACRAGRRGPCERPRRIHCRIHFPGIWTKQCFRLRHRNSCTRNSRALAAHGFKSDDGWFKAKPLNRTAQRDYRKEKTSV